MGTLTFATELTSLITAALVLIVSVGLLGLWGMLCILSPKWKTISFSIGGILVMIDGCYGLATWIILIIKRQAIRDPLESVSGYILGRERIIAAGFACWIFLLMLQVQISIPLLI